MPHSGAYRFVTAEAVEKSVPPTCDAPDFDALYRSHYARMVTLARLMTGAMASAEEIVQDAFVQVYRNWSSIEYPVTYLRIAVVHGSRSYGRRRALARRHPERAPEPVVFDGVAIAVREVWRAPLTDGNTCIYERAIGPGGDIRNRGAASCGGSGTAWGFLRTERARRRKTPECSLPARPQPFLPSKTGRPTRSHRRRKASTSPGSRGCPTGCAS
jgi:hypothetical protein